MMHDIALEKYLTDYTDHESELLQKIFHETYADIPMAQMISGHYQGRLLAMFSKMISPKKILEIGTFTGYSTICLAEGLQQDGIIHTIDKNGDLRNRVISYFKEANIEKNVVYHIGNALEIISQLDSKFDLVFIDADKKNYCAYYDLVFDRLNKDGYIIADNVLWKGKVLNADYAALDKKTRSIVDFNNMIKNDKRVEILLLPVRDGVMLIHKK